MYESFILCVLAKVLSSEEKSRYIQYRKNSQRESDKKGY